MTCMSLPAIGRFPIGHIWRITSAEMSGALGDWTFLGPGHYQTLVIGRGANGGSAAAFESAGAGAGTAGEVRTPWPVFQADAGAQLQHRLTTYGAGYASNVEIRMTGKATVTASGGQHGGAPSGAGGSPNGGNAGQPGGAGAQHEGVTNDLIAAWLGRLAKGVAGTGGAANGARGGGGGGYGGANVIASPTGDGIGYSGQTAPATPQSGLTGFPGGVATGYGAGAPGAGGNASGDSYGGTGNPGVILIQKVGA